MDDSQQSTVSPKQIEEFLLIPPEQTVIEPKHPGQPLKIKTLEELETKIDAYFWGCDNRTKEIATKLGRVTVLNPEPYTMSGLAYSLGIDRKTLLNYSHRDEYFPTVKNARNRVEADVEKRMNDHETFTPGLIFNLKNNFDWHDKTEVEQSGGIDINVNAFLNKVYGSTKLEPTSTT